MTWHFGYNKKNTKKTKTIVLAPKAKKTKRMCLAQTVENSRASWYNSLTMVQEVEEKIYRTIRDNNLIDANQHIVLGLSGGPDSVCLFHVLLKLVEKQSPAGAASAIRQQSSAGVSSAIQQQGPAGVANLTIHAVHVNHKFRPGAAEEDQKFVEDLCRAKGVACHSFVYDCNQIAAAEKITSEEAGRNARYEAFAKVAQELVDSGIPRKMLRIVVAQNADDQAETILFRVLRGAGTDGLAGIAYSRFDQYGNMIVRPLLDVYKEEVLQYCEEEGLEPRIDKTNLESVYARNKIRLELIPLLEREYNTNIKETINRMGVIAATDKDYLWQQAASVFETAGGEPESNTIRLDAGDLRGEHKAIRLRVYSMALKAVGLSEDVTFKHLEGCDSIVFNDKPSASLDLPQGFVCRKIYKQVEFAWASNKDTNDEKNNKNLRVSIVPYEEFNKKDKLPRNIATFDYEKLQLALWDETGRRTMQDDGTTTKSISRLQIENSLALRNRRAGDYICLDDSKSKKLQDFFVDCKVPKSQRDQVKLVALGSQILWVLPLERENQEAGTSGQAGSNGKKAALLQKGRFSGRYKLCEATKNVIIVEIIV